MRKWTRREVLKSGVVVSAGFVPIIQGEAGAYGDSPASSTNETPSKIEIAVAGDLLGHLIGTLSRNQGTAAVVGAEVKVSGRTPSGAWTRTATTGENGLFQINFPLGSIGPIHISSKSNGSTAKHTIDSGDIAVGLTPRSSARDSRVSLEGEWEFGVDPQRESGAPAEIEMMRVKPPSPANWGKIDVPSHWAMKGFKAETGSAAYRRSVKIPNAWQAKRIKFRSDGIYSRSEVWVNGRRIGGHDGGSTPFELDITDAAKPGAENSIYILAHDSSDAGDLDCMSYYAHFSLGGIWRPLEVFCVEPAHIARLAITTDFDGLYQDAELSVDLDIVNEQTKEIHNAALKLECVDPNGKPVSLEGLSAKVSLGPWERKRVTLRTKVMRPEQWSAEIPRLYKLKAELNAPHQSTAAVEQPFGFREVEIKGHLYLINGRPIKMWGADRLEAHPLMGRAITPEIARQDVELMKGANLNSMRTTSYLQHPAGFDAADELGLYVEDEAPFCFVSVPWGPPTGRNRNLSEDLRLAPLTIRETSEMLERDRNHPSVVMWSICNESRFGRIFQMAHKFVRESDPTRPTSAGQSVNLEQALQAETPISISVGDPNVEIAAYHCPTSMKRIKETAEFQVPVLFDEAFPIFQGYGAEAQGLELDPGLRDFWVTAHFEPLEAIAKSDHHFGTQIVCWVDDTFLVPGRGIEYGRLFTPKSHVGDIIYGMPGRGIVGDLIWGIIEGWRRIRPEWWLSKKLFSPIRIKEEPLQPSTPIRVPVENRNFFANLNRYVCKWRLDDESGELRADIPPQTSGVIAIRPRKAPGASDILTLEFFDEHKKLIDGYELAFRSRETFKPTLSGKPAKIVEEPSTLDFGSIVDLVGAQCELGFDRTSGGLIRGIADNQMVLLAGPQLHVMKSYAALEAYPADWHFTGEKYATENGRAVLHWKGSYGDQFTGGFLIQMDDAGNIEMGYNFTYHGADMLAREIGLGLEVPLSCDRLEWHRQAEWSYYPDDHIGRPHGVAVAHPDVRQTTPPNDRPFGLDDHVWGCNDFRSVKRNVHWATVTGPDGSGIRVLSDGHQHVRATVSIHSIRVKILDYYGGSATGFHEWDDTYGNGHAISSGNVLKGTIRLQLLPGQSRS